MMDLESGLQYFLRDVLYVAGGAIILRARTQDMNWFSEKVDALDVVNALRIVQKRLFCSLPGM